MWHCHLNDMKIPETKRFIPKGFELGATSQLVHASACVCRDIEHLGSFGEHERGVRVARDADECNSSFLSALQTSQVLNISTYALLKHELIVL